MALLTESFAPWLRDPHRFFVADSGFGAFIPAADVIVTEQDVTVYMDVPGLTAENLEIEIEDDVLTVSGRREQPYGEQGGDRAWGHFERRFGSFERVLNVPKGLDPDAVEASMVDGVLMLHIPKPEPLKPRRIQIAGAGASEIEAGESSPAAEAEESREPAGATA
ncbi:MAG: HSP20 family small heat-shock protein [Actinomycetota bacterium]|nr:HSP20 family small heat-shock protein [Actinomycetota bacterium]